MVDLSVWICMDVTLYLKVGAVKGQRGPETEPR